MVKLLGMPELSSLLTKAKNENLNYSKKNGLDTNSLNLTIGENRWNFSLRALVAQFKPSFT